MHAGSLGSEIPQVLLGYVLPGDVEFVCLVEIPRFYSVQALSINNSILHSQQC
jgi:hypothetical protein